MDSTIAKERARARERQRESRRTIEEEILWVKKGWVGVERRLSWDRNDSSARSLPLVNMAAEFRSSLSCGAVNSDVIGKIFISFLAFESCIRARSKATRACPENRSFNSQTQAEWLRLQLQAHFDSEAGRLRWELWNCEALHEHAKRYSALFDNHRWLKGRPHWAAPIKQLLTKSFENMNHLQANKKTINLTIASTNLTLN